MGDPFRLDGMTALVTGGAQGIGLGIARGLRDAGAEVVIVDLDGAAAAAAADAIGARHEVVDLRVLDATAALADRVGAVDVLVNNAGVYPPSAWDELTPEQFDEVLGVNLRGPLFFTQAIVRHMQRGSIINLASISAFRPGAPGLVHYGASKGAMLTITKHLAVVLAPRGIRVNALVPGGIRTPGTGRMSEGTSMTDIERNAYIAAFAARVPLGRLGEPADFAGPAVFLASSASAYVTGAVITVDGGMLLV